MANTVCGAAIERYEALGSLPAIFFDMAPAKTTGGTPLLPPYVVLKHRGTRPVYASDTGPVEQTDIAFHVYAPTLAAAEETAWAIRFGGGTPGDGAGFDTAMSLPMTRRALVASGCVRTGERMSRAGDDLNGGPVHLIELTYSVTTLTTG